LKKAPSKKRRLPVSHGFTLLELLISLTIVGVILVLIFGSLRIGSRAWEKGEADVEVQQRERVVLGLMRRQIASICDREIDTEDGAYLFKGNDRSMTFTSRAPVIPTIRSGMVYVKYMVNASVGDENQLLFYEQDVVANGGQARLEEIDEADFDMLIPSVHHIFFEYLKRTEEEDAPPQWQKAWDPESDEGLPMAVKVVFQRNDEANALRVIARIHPEKEDK